MNVSDQYGRTQDRDETEDQVRMDLDAQIRFHERRIDKQLAETRCWSSFRSPSKNARTPSDVQNRQPSDLVDKESREAEILSISAPQMGEEEIQSAEDALKEGEAASRKDMGKVMGV